MVFSCPATVYLLGMAETRSVNYRKIYIYIYIYRERESMCVCVSFVASDQRLS